MTQMEHLTKHVMGSDPKNVIVVDAKWSWSYEDVEFDNLYNEEVQFLTNQARSSRPTFQIQGGNQGWNKEKEGDWRNKERDDN